MTGTIMRLHIRGIKRYRVGDQEYCYHRATNTPIKAPFGTPEFVAEVTALNTRVIPKKKALPGSLGLLVEAFRRSSDWSVLRPETRVSYDRVFVLLRPLSDLPLVQLSRPFVFELRDQKIFPKRGRWMANYMVTVLSIILRFAENRGWIKTNPLSGRIKKIRNTSEVAANRPWSTAERRAVIERAPGHLRLPLALAMCAGLRKGDFLTLTMTAIKNGEIAVRTSKRGVVVRVPIHPVLAEALAERPKSNVVQVAVNSRGEPWTKTGFNASWRTFKMALEAEGVIEPGLTPHGLRHTLGTMMREAGADDRTISDVLGQKSTSMGRHYSENAKLPEAAKRMMTELDFIEGENEPCTKIV
jgi:integrase